MKKIFYTTAALDPQALHNVHTYISHMDIIAPQCYALQSDGVIAGQPDSQLITIASQHKVSVMPLIINQGFDQNAFHQFLQNQEKQKSVIEQLIKLCQENNYCGIQFDFENILISDKEKYTDFYREAAQSFHNAGLIISIAIVPCLYDNYTDKSAYQQWIFKNWSGVYDQKALAAVSDFIALMAYDQHTRHTPPGPIAGLPWFKQLLTIALESIEPQKLSLGIPFYSGYWTTEVDADKPTAVRKGFSYDKVQDLVQSKQIGLTWDAIQKVHYAVLTEEFNNHYLFVEDYDSLREKLNIINQYGLHGFSAWCIGFEDTKFYDLLGTTS